MTSILGLPGRLRKGLFSTALLRAAAALMPAGASLDVATLHAVRRRCQARDGILAAVTALKQRSSTATHR